MLFPSSPQLRQYLLITGNYWAFTLTDGALRMLVVLHFHQLGYSPLNIALLFLFYEFFGVVTNLLGGWLGARWGLNKTMNIGLGLQVCALLMLTAPANMLTVAWVMLAQAMSGIAKDLNKMSAKSSIKLLTPADSNGQQQLYRWVARLTGSKNALKGAGFFLGAALLATLGFRSAVLALAGSLTLVWLFSLCSLQQDLGKAKNKIKFRDIFSKSRAINYLSAARLCLFSARDVWFVVALPVYLATAFGWSAYQVGGFLALWIMGYGAVQSMAPLLTGIRRGHLPDGKSAACWALALAGIPALMAAALANSPDTALPVVIGGLLVFGVLFALNSAIHSFLIISYAQSDGVSLDVGFYYMANALGRLSGTVLSGYVFQQAGLVACLWLSSGFVVMTTVLSLALPRQTGAVVVDVNKLDGDA